MRLFVALTEISQTKERHRFLSEHMTKSPVQVFGREWIVTIVSGKYRKNEDYGMMWGSGDPARAVARV